MVAITLPDGSVRAYDGPVTAAEVAADIGPGLAKAALVARVDGALWDLGRAIEADAQLAILTARDDEVLELIRHDAAHVLAEAVKELWPGVQVTIGPAIENGFYYDFSRDETFTPEDLETIETRMREIVARDEEIVREVWTRADAIAHFQSNRESYKAEIVADLPEDEEITIYRQGDFIDLCRGPHLGSTGKLGTAFKLTKLAGAYWRGDSRNEMLQRIYGTAWRTEKELKAYLYRVEEAEKRDHRRLGQELGLFHLQEESPGMVFWHPKGWTMYLVLEAYVRRKLDRAGYLEVHTPEVVDRSLWERSGHWEKFQEHMYTTEYEDRVFALKPMNCPCHVQIFRHGLRSYRELPMRMAEFGSCHRLEPSGALHGLMRVRNFVQDDGHIFCTEDQITSESIAFCDLLLDMYRDLGFADVVINYADRPAERVGDDAVWDHAEQALLDAVDATGLKVHVNPGEGAFYGPKLEFVLRDAIGRDWQCGTLQVDFVMPERLGASYIGEDGARHVPVMLHRAILGSMERFFGILVEEHAGRFPLWLAPVQAVVATITSEGDDYARTVQARLAAAGLRAELDLRNEKINLKVREHSLAKVPAIIAIGKREAEEGTVSVRRLGSKGQEVLALDEAVVRLTEEAVVPGA
jgi:threonyl-tRNA synthetase